MRSLNSLTDGFTLLDVLIAIIVLSIGLLGISALQMISLRNNHNAHLRSLASIYSYELADKMRANLAGTEAGNYRGSSAPANPTTIPEKDLAHWFNTRLAALPSGRGIIACEPLDSSTPNDPDAPCDTTLTGASTSCPRGTVHEIGVCWLENENNHAFVSGFRP